MDDKESCEAVYLETKRRLEEGLVYLQKNRKNDPYRDLIPRVLYEQNSSKKAPSFPC